MSNEVRIAVTGQNTSGAAVNTARRDVRDLGDEAQKTAKRVVELGVAEEAAARGAKGLGRGLDEAGDEAAELARKMALAAAAGAVFNTELNRFVKNGKFISEGNLFGGGGKGGGGGDKGGLFGGLKGQAAKAGVEGAGTFASAWQSGIMTAFKALPPEAQIGIGAGIAAAVVASGPLIISAVNGAILAGVGAGGLAAGIAMQVKDPVVAGAFKDLGGRITKDLGQATTPFRGQLLSSVDTFGAAWTKILPNLQGFFTTLAPSVGKLAEGAAKAATLLGPALERAAGPAGKILDTIAEQIPNIANQLASLLDKISEHGDSAAAAVEFILVNVEALIMMFGVLVDTMGGAADGATRIGQALGIISGGGLDKMLVSINEAGPASESTAASVEYLNRAVYNTADAANQANEAFGRLFGEMMNLDEANIAVAEDFRQLSKALKTSNGDLSEGTEAGLKNRKMILGMVQDLEQQREAAIAAGNGTVEATQKANAAYLAQLQKLRALAVAAGASTTAIDALIGKYQNLANQPDITKRITIINTAIYRTVTDSSGTHETGRGLSRDRAVGGVQGAASGGARDGLTWVGEDGPELISLAAGTSVYTAGQSRRMAGGMYGMGGGGAGQALDINVTGDPLSWLYQAIMDGIQQRKVTVRRSSIVD